MTMNTNTNIDITTSTTPEIPAIGKHWYSNQPITQQDLDSAPDLFSKLQVLSNMAGPGRQHISAALNQLRNAEHTREKYRKIADGIQEMFGDILWDYIEDQVADLIESKIEDCITTDDLDPSDVLTQDNLDELKDDLAGDIRSRIVKDVTEEVISEIEDRARIRLR
jgi:hypothetical protein